MSATQKLLKFQKQEETNSKVYGHTKIYAEMSPARAKTIDISHKAKINFTVNKKNTRIYSKVVAHAHYIHL